jgi:hypothetical protein
MPYGWRSGSAVRPDIREDTVPERTVARLATCAPGLLADLECVTGMTSRPGEWARITTPVSLLSGERSTADYTRSTAQLRTIFPAAGWTVLPGQAHFPDDMTPIAATIG